MEKKTWELHFHFSKFKIRFLFLVPEIQKCDVRSALLPVLFAYSCLIHPCVIFQVQSVSPSFLSSISCSSVRASNEL